MILAEVAATLYGATRGTIEQLWTVLSPRPDQQGATRFKVERLFEQLGLYVVQAQHLFCDIEDGLGAQSHNGFVFTL